MKIKTNRQIQQLVDQMVDEKKADRARAAATLFVCSTSLVDRLKPEKGKPIQKFDRAGVHRIGVETGVWLYQKYLKAVGKALQLNVILKADSVRTLDVQVYVASTLTSEGNDYLYFVGDKEEILAKLRRATCS